jgi:hypothetical protein
MFLTILCVVTSLIAQAECAVYDYGQFVPGSTVLLFGDKVNARVQPSINAEVVATLTIGEPMQIISMAETRYTVNDYTTNWYQVAFEDEGEIKEGYIWGGLLSIVSLSLVTHDEENSDVFVFGITGFSEEKGFTGEARMAMDGNIVSRVGFDIMGHTDEEGGGYSHSISGIALGDAGFSHLDNIFVLSFLYEACGVTNGDLLLFWNGKKLSYGAQGVSISEADAFSETFQFYFPNEIEGSPDYLIHVQSYNEYYDDVPAENTVKLYKWNGKVLEQIPPE